VGVILNLAVWFAIHTLFQDVRVIEGRTDRGTCREDRDHPDLEPEHGYRGAGGQQRRREVKRGQNREVEGEPRDPDHPHVLEQGVDRVAATLGAILTTWVTFMPCFLWIFAGAPFVEQLRGVKRGQNREVEGEPRDPDHPHVLEQGVDRKPDGKVSGSRSG
jgi:hypothetical protein